MVPGGGTNICFYVFISVLKIYYPPFYIEECVLSRLDLSICIPHVGVDKKVDIKWRQKTGYQRASSGPLRLGSTAMVLAYG